jgi:tetratricopeptide (TPR) repeat protein
MSPEIVEALASSHGDEVDGPHDGRPGGRLDRSPGIGDRPRWAESLEDARALDAQLDDIELGDDIDRQVARELARGKPGPVADDVADDLPFDPDEARAFDAAVPRSSNQVAAVGHAMEPGGTDAIYVSGFEETDLPHAAGASDTGAYDELADDGLPISGGYDPYGTEAPQTPGTFGGEPTVAQNVGSFSEPTASTEAAFGESTASTQSPAFGADTPMSFGPDTSLGEPPAEAPAPGGPRADTSLEDDLDEAEFYASQRMFGEAIDLLNTLLIRVPGHRLVLAKLREVEALAAGGEVALDVGSGGHPPAPGGTDALDLDEIEEMGPEELVELDANSQPIQTPRKRQPTVMLEKPVDEGDVDTHYDLGLAYKEMALYDDAIKAFEQALRAPGREVGCRVMIGMCLREQGNPSEAVHQFKQGLHAEPTERERQSLYYEIGITYEAIGDDSEALYFFEMVLKRDPTFADAGTRAERLRARGGRATHSRDNDV